MVEESGPVTGGCMCGEVRYEAVGGPLMGVAAAPAARGAQ